MIHFFVRNKQLNLLSKMIISFNKTQILFKENDKFVSPK